MYLYQILLKDSGYVNKDYIVVRKDIKPTLNPDKIKFL